MEMAPKVPGNVTSRLVYWDRAPSHVAGLRVVEGGSHRPWFGQDDEGMEMTKWFARAEGARAIPAPEAKNRRAMAARPPPPD